HAAEEILQLLARAARLGRRHDASVRLEQFPGPVDPAGDGLSLGRKRTGQKNPFAGRIGVLRRKAVAAPPVPHLFRIRFVYGGELDLLDGDIHGITSATEQIKKGDSVAPSGLMPRLPLSCMVAAEGLEPPTLRV